MDIFNVIADPTRRQMLEMMTEGHRAAGDFVAAFPQVSQPAISQHLKVLRDANLVDVTIDKQRRLYSLKTDFLSQLHSWVDIFIPHQKPVSLQNIAPSITDAFSPNAVETIENTPKVSESTLKLPKAPKPKKPKPQAQEPANFTLDLFG